MIRQDSKHIIIFIACCFSQTIIQQTPATMSMPVSDPHGTVDPEKQARHHRHFTKLRNKVDSLQSDISRLGIAISTTWNPNHRHDEEWEKEVDSKMEAIRDSHRFRSFSGERDGNIVKWHVDGHGATFPLFEDVD